MALIIKAENPSCCGACHECDYNPNSDKFYCAVDGKCRKYEPPRPSDCPIIGEIDEHKKIIYFEDVREFICDNYRSIKYSGKDGMLHLLSDMSKKIPTIVEAST